MVGAKALVVASSLSINHGWKTISGFELLLCSLCEVPQRHVPVNETSLLGIPHKDAVKAFVCLQKDFRENKL